MKILVFLIVVFSYSATAKSYSQNQKVSMNMEQASIIDVLNEIKQQTGLRFIFKQGLFDESNQINIEVENEEVKVVLDQLLREKGLECEVEEEVITFKKIVKPLPIKEQQEKKSVTGKVTDKDGIPLPGVSVVIKGTNTGVATDVDGNYTLELENEQAKLIFSFVGMLPEEINYIGQSLLNVSLMADSEQMAEVVVTGYQTISKERATGSFQIVNEEDLDNVASLDVAQRLSGIAPGVHVNDAGEISIRGVGTLMAETQPLIVVNGFPWHGDLVDINVDDVDQITVLKDAASTSIYGVRGANGVVVITTKKANKSGELNVNYTNSFQIGQQSKIEDLDFLNGSQHVDLEWEMYANDPGSPMDWPGYNYKSPVGELYKAWTNTMDPTEQAEYISQRDGLAVYDNAKELEDEFFRKTFTQKHTLSFNYGTQKNMFYASVAFDENKSYLQGANSQNFAINLNDEFKFNDLFKLRLNVIANYRKNENNGHDPSRMLPYHRLRDENGDYVSENRTSYDLERIALREGSGLLSTFYNRAQERELIDNETSFNRIATNAAFDFSPAKWLKLTASFSYDIQNTRTESLWDKESFQVRELVNKFTEYPTMKQYVPYGDILDYGNRKDENYTGRLQFNINKELGDFVVGLNGGIERNEFFYKQDVNNRRYDYNEQRLTESFIDTESMRKGIDSYYAGYYINMFGMSFYSPGKASLSFPPYMSASKNRYQSTYLIGNVTYKNKYDLSVSWRLDKTNTFGQSSEYNNQPSWSVGSKWLISDENFFDVEFVNSLSLKASYGLSGNIDTSTSPFLVAEQQNHYYTGEDYLKITNPENPLLGWEKTRTFNIGLDFSLLKNRLNGTIEYYNKQSSDVLAEVAVETTNGFGGSYNTVLMNNGEILNQGIDIGLNAVIISNKNFQYNMGLNVSYNYNEVTSLGVAATTIMQAVNGTSAGYQVEGQPVNYLYGFNSAPLDNTGNAQIYDRNGNIRPWNDIANMDIDDGKFYGRTTPPVFGSFINSLSYKNFTADFFFLFDLGHHVNLYPSNRNQVEFMAANSAVSEIYNERWRSAGDEEFTRIPALSPQAELAGGEQTSATWNSDIAYDNADVIRLKSLKLSYDLSSLLKGRSVKQLKVSAGVENLWHWTATDTDRIYDRIGTYPAYKNFTIGLKMTL